MPVSDQELLKTMHDIGGLLYRRLTGDLNETEQIELDQWIIRQDQSSRQFFEDCTDHDQIYAALNTMYAFDQEAALKELQKRIPIAAESSPPIIGHSKSGWRWYRYVMAASIILVFSSIGIDYLLGKHAPTASEPIAKRYKNDIAPGGEKATLRLADGSTVVLDNASNGQLAQQGSTKVVKLDNGQLAYHANKTAENAVGYNSISTPRGGQYQVVLPDGSKVWLNAASALKFPTAFVGKERSVELTGEAFFQIEKNPSMPFRVTVTKAAGDVSTVEEGGLQIEVMGTEFDVMGYNDENMQKATLVTGMVTVSNGKDKIQLKPGEQASLGKQSSALRVSDVNVEEVTAWKNGLFQFHDASIESIMREVQRWYDIDVSFQGKIEKQFNGTIPRRVSISTVLKILESTGWVHFTIDGKKVTVIP